VTKRKEPKRTSRTSRDDARVANKSGGVPITYTGDLRSAEVVLHQPLKLNAKHCWGKCLKLFKPQEVRWLVRFYGDKRDGDARAVSLGLSVAQSKEIKSRMVECLQKCVEEAREKASAAAGLELDYKTEDYDPI